MMMENLKRKGEAVAAEVLQTKKAQLTATLIEELPDDIAVEESDDAVIVSGRQLNQEIVDNDSLRDVAFLMRGVR